MVSLMKLLQSFNQKEVSPIDFDEVKEAINNVTKMGSKKHGINTWLDPANKSLQHISNHNSMFHHLSESFTGKIKDDESGIHPLIHLAWRALAEYYRQKNNIS